MNSSTSQRQASSAKVAAAAQLERNNYVAMVAHELRDPLMPIINAAAVLLRDPADVLLVQRSAAVIERQARIMSNLIDDLMNISRVQASKLRLNRAPVSMAEVIRRCLETAAPSCEQRHQSLCVSVSATPMEMDADAARLIQALRNLIVNAAKFSDNGAEVHVRAERDGSDAVVTVIDSGIGIESADLEPIFSLFIQGGNGRTMSANNGLGIGLFLARQFAEAHGGSLRAASAGPGRGSSFTLRIPCLPIDLRVAQWPVSTSSDDPTPASPRHSIHTTVSRAVDDRAP